MLSRTPVRPIDPVLGRVDAALFTGPMLLIGPDNAAVGIVDGHEAAALAIARGHGTTWAAQVRPGVIALDVDLAHAGLAELVLDDLIGWCRRRGLWHVTRPSGGGPGRHHLVVVPGITRPPCSTRSTPGALSSRSPARRSTSGRPSGRSARHTAPDAAPRPPCLLTTTWTHSARLYRPFRGVPSPSARPPRWPGLSESFLQNDQGRFSCPRRPNVPGTAAGRPPSSSRPSAWPMPELPRTRHGRSYPRSVAARAPAVAAPGGSAMCGRECVLRRPLTGSI